MATHYKNQISHNNHIQVVSYDFWWNVYKCRINMLRGMPNHFSLQRGNICPKNMVCDFELFQHHREIVNQAVSYLGLESI